MDLPETLPARLYLLGVDRARRRVVPRDQLGYAMRAAALVDLARAGALTDDPHRPTATGRPVSDGFEAAVLAEIAGSRPRSWGHWVQRRARQARDTVRDGLAAGGWIGVECHRVLGVFPVERIDVRDATRHEAFVGRVRQLLRGVQPVSRVDAADAALVALAAGAELRTAVSRADRRAYRKRIADLTASTGAVAPALHKVIRQLHAQRAAGASAAGSAS